MLSNFFTIAPLALWGCISLLMGMILRNHSIELRLHAWIAMVLMYVIFVLYYILLILYFKSSSTNVEKNKRHAFICLLSGTVFHVISLLI